MAYTVRRAVLADIPTIAAMDVAANKHNGLFSTPWMPSGGWVELLIHRDTWLLNHPNSTVLVACTTSETGGKIVGVLVGTRPDKEGEPVPSYVPVPPADADLEALKNFIGRAEAMKKRVWKEEYMWELTSCSIDPAYQRKGVGALLLKTWLADVDKEGPVVYVNATREGKGLYEKFGWRFVEELVNDLDAGKTSTSYSLVRAAKGKEVESV